MRNFKYKLRINKKSCCWSSGKKMFPLSPSVNRPLEIFLQHYEWNWIIEKSFCTTYFWQTCCFMETITKHELRKYQIRGQIHKNLANCPLAWWWKHKKTSISNKQEPFQSVILILIYLDKQLIKLQLDWHPLLINIQKEFQRPLLLLIATRVSCLTLFKIIGLHFLCAS